MSLNQNRIDEAIQRADAVKPEERRRYGSVREMRADIAGRAKERQAAEAANLGLDKLEQLKAAVCDAESATEWINALNNAAPALIAELREARATIDRVRTLASGHASTRWRATPSLSTEYAEGMNQAATKIMRLLDGRP
ncbi:hypothetical protein GS917_24945 [Rhodococcus hoagii]|nr:hypothetical protein [Prescottella equi]